MIRRQIVTTAAVTVTVLLSCSLISAQTKIRDLPIKTTPASGDFFPLDAATGSTWKTTLGGILSGVVAKSTILNCTAPLLCDGSTATDLSASSHTFSLAPFYLPLTGGTMTGDVAMGSNKITMAGTYTPTSNGAPFRLLTTSSTVTGATNQGVRTALFSLFDTNTSNIDSAAMTVNIIQRTNPTAGTIIRTGLHINSYTQKDNGGDSSAILVTTTGGGCGICVYQLPGLRPTGYTNYEDTLQGALEAGTSAQNFSLMSVSGSQLGGVTTNESTAILARVDNATSRAFVAFPSDATWDTRDAFVVGFPQVNADPVQIHSRLLMSGKLSLGVITSPDSRLTITDNTATTAPTVLAGTIFHAIGADAVASRALIDTFAAVPGYDTRRANGTLASPSAIVLNDVIWQSGGFGYGTTAYSSGSRASIQYFATENWTDTAQGAMVSIGTTSNSSTTKSTKVDILGNGHVNFYQSAVPTITCTGTGTSPASPTVVGTDLNFTATINTGTGSPGSTGTCTVTYNTAFTTNIPTPVCMLVKGSTAWGNGATIQLTTESLSAPVFTWTNLVGGVATALTVSTSYKFNCVQFGR